jgi:hypothetical protein
VYTLTCVTYVLAGVTLTIEPGTVVVAKKRGAGDATAVALVVRQGGRLVANGTAAAPITFTAQENIDHFWTAARALLARGRWGGLVILGRAPVAGGGSRQLSPAAAGGGCMGCTYGGADESAGESSGVLRYVRIWYAGDATGSGGFTSAGLTLGRVVCSFA